ncbi:MAG: polysaccharide deacetylase family protein [Planctomycetota bacterium]
MSILLPIYMYHEITPTAAGRRNSHLQVSAGALSRQIDELRGLGFALVTLSEAWGRIEEGIATPRLAVLTFDDLDQAFYEHAWPVLQERNAPATAFYITGEPGLGSPSRMTDPGRKLARGRLLELADGGVEIGSHTVTHRELIGLADAEALEELVGSRSDLEEKLGRPVSTLCYPRGRFSRRIMTLAEEAGYACACATLRGSLQSRAERFALRRIRADEARSGLRLRYTAMRLYDLWNLPRRRREQAAYERQERAWL